MKQGNEKDNEGKKDEKKKEKGSLAKSAVAVFLNIVQKGGRGRGGVKPMFKNVVANFV